MTIRRARIPEDLPVLVEMGRKFIASDDYAGKIAFRPEKVEHLLRFLADRPDRLLLVSERSGVITGMIGFVSFPHPMSGELTAAESFWWSERPGDGIQLLRAAEAWAEAIGAELVQMVAPNERVGALYQRLGYQPIEAMYQRRVQ